MMEIKDLHKEIKNAIIKSQHCQRNWDLSREIPDEDLDLILYSATQCPSKQNNSYYKVYAITKRDVIEQIYDTTVGFTISYEPLVRTTNSQTLANLLLVFTEERLDTDKVNFNEEYHNMHDQDKSISESSKLCLDRDSKVALGIAAGYVNLTSTLLGYSTGCCQCFHEGTIRKILNIDSKPLLLMGIGFKDPSRNRREHHREDFVFPSFKKSEIDVTVIK